ncbi:MAG: endonuclease [Winogradskyella sp.]|nr:endonuclease [Winogradskyella sp.]
MTNSSHTYTLAFYNIENLFDIENDPKTNDDDFLPTSAKRWTIKRYQNKLRKLGSVISQIGDEKAISAPIIVGLAEVENKNVIEDLINISTLKAEDYSFIHYDSSDERGIDVALLYKSDSFQVEYSEVYSVYLQNDLGLRDFTRDILVVKGKLNHETLYILINHWSSRREGEDETLYKRMAAATKAIEIIQGIKVETPKAKIVVMGDFNDNPDSKSLLHLTKEGNLYNPFKTVWNKDEGSLNHNFKWNQFDQILISTNFFDPENTLTLQNADVFNNKFLTQYHGKYKGQPFRTYVGKKYKGGYSDHFPVYIQLKQS